jgi:hypothetical protein
MRHMLARVDGANPQHRVGSTLLLDGDYPCLLWPPVVTRCNALSSHSLYASLQPPDTSANCCRTSIFSAGRWRGPISRTQGCRR